VLLRKQRDVLTPAICLDTHDASCSFSWESLRVDGSTGLSRDAFVWGTRSLFRPVDYVITYTCNLWVGLCSMSQVTRHWSRRPIPAGYLPSVSCEINLLSLATYQVTVYEPGQEIKTQRVDEGLPLFFRRQFTLL